MAPKKSGEKARSAVTGKYVKKSYAKKNPRTTVIEHDKPRSKPKKPTPAAVAVFREHAHRYPAKSWYQDIADAVGEEESDLAFWGRVVKEWVGLGWNPTNAKGMLEFYERKKLPGTDQRGRQSGPLNAMEEYAKLAAEEGWDDDDP